MTKKILCRADGNAKTGLGHLYRMFAIAAFYKEHYELIFLTRSTSVTSIIPKEYKVVLIPKEISIIEEPEWIATQYNFEEYCIIADGYQFVSQYQKSLKAQGFTLIYIDDLTSQHMYADVVVNHSPHCTKEHFKAENYTQFALGTDYAMLRPRFNLAAKSQKNITFVENAFICFGGADQYDLSFKASLALLNNNIIKQIHVVLGGAYNHEEIFKLAKNNSKLYLYKNLDEESLYDVMNSCQVAIAPSSTILYELCSVKMPVFSGYYVENQKNINESFSKKEVIFNGGDLSVYSTKDFEKQMQLFFSDLDITSYLSKQQELFDGKNKIRFLSLLNRLHVSCRKATEDDLMLVYNWSNDKLVRDNSYNSEPIELKNHTNWFLKKVKETNTLFLIIEVNKIAAGIVRFEISDLNAVVSVLVAKEYRGQKLASVFLEVAAKEYFTAYNQPVLAYIKKENTASVKSFEKAKYVYFKEETIQGSSSFVYKLEKSNEVR